MQNMNSQLWGKVSIIADGCTNSCIMRAVDLQYLNHICPMIIFKQSPKASTFTMFKRQSDRVQGIIWVCCWKISILLCRIAQSHDPKKIFLGQDNDISDKLHKKTPCINHSTTSLFKVVHGKFALKKLCDQCMHTCWNNG